MQHLDQRQLLLLENAYYQVRLNGAIRCTDQSHSNPGIVQPTRTDGKADEGTNTHGVVHETSHLRCSHQEDDR